MYTLEIGGNLLTAVVVVCLAGLVREWWRFRVQGRR